MLGESPLDGGGTAVLLCVGSGEALEAAASIIGCCTFSNTLRSALNPAQNDELGPEGYDVTSGVRFNVGHRAVLIPHHLLHHPWVPNPFHHLTQCCRVIQCVT